MPSVTAHTAHTILVAPLMLPVCVLFVLAPTVRLVPVLTLSSVSIVRAVQYTTHVLLSSLRRSELPSHSAMYFVLLFAEGFKQAKTLRRKPVAAFSTSR